MRGRAAAIALGAWIALGGAASAGVPEALPDAPPFPPELRRALARALAERPPDETPRTRHRASDGTPLYTNRLLLESSPYLRQHAHNPVDWRPWGEEAFAEARARGRPVLVSIGYSTCHWCHVMEEESFDDPEIARLLNAHFIAIKVDREVRPDVDSVYMAAIRAMGRSGGWPLNVWVTPDRQPFFAGTYFPPRDRDGRPGLTTVLESIRSEYAARPESIERRAAQLEATIRGRMESNVATATQVPGPETLRLAARQALSRMDWSWGGFRGRPKFPSSVPLRFLLRYHRRTGDAQALEAVTLTLEKLAAGGVRDHLGGGFHRYATDARWLVPHFEKMLYDNATLAQVYLEAWQVTGRRDFADVVRGTLGYVQREMTAPGGGFYSASDADSPGPDGEPEEGRFFTWTPAETARVLGPQRARAVDAWFGITPEGHLEGRSVLHTWREADALAAELEIPVEALRRTLAESRERLYQARSRRPAPFRDEKALAAWNGLMVSAFARAGLALDDAGYVASAERAADFVLTEMRADGRLRRIAHGRSAEGAAFLEDHAFLIAGLLDLYEASPDPRWLREALALQSQLDAHYADESGGGYYRTAAGAEHVLAREKPATDGALPSGNSVAALNLLRLADLTFDPAYRQRAVQLFSAQTAFQETPAAFGELLLALEYLHDTPKEIVIVRPASAAGDLNAMLAPLRRSFVPNRVLAVVPEGDGLDEHAALAPLVKGRRAREEQVTAYVCENRVCERPTADPEVFARQIRKVTPLAAP
jgi:uncharacterized protein YyaL (SSP411 family)